jgi:hypothetical protein
VLGDLTRVGEWIEGISQVQVDGMKRVCTFAKGAVQHEEIRDFAPKTHSYRYSIEGGPLPLKTNHGSFVVLPGENGSRVIWASEIEATDPDADAEISGLLRTPVWSRPGWISERLETRPVWCEL